MANKEDPKVDQMDPTEVVAEFEKSDTKGLTPDELIARHMGEVGKINEEMQKLQAEAKEHNAALEKIRNSMLSLGTIRSERIGAIKGLKELTGG